MSMCVWEIFQTEVKIVQNGNFYSIMVLPVIFQTCIILEKTKQLGVQWLSFTQEDIIGDDTSPSHDMTGAMYQIMLQTTRKPTGATVNLRWGWCLWLIDHHKLTLAMLSSVKQEWHWWAVVCSYAEPSVGSLSTEIGGANKSESFSWSEVCFDWMGGGGWLLSIVCNI